MKYTEAIGLGQAVSEGHVDRTALLGLALVLSWRSQLDSAIAVYHRVRQIEPRNREGRFLGWPGPMAA